MLPRLFAILFYLLGTLSAKAATPDSVIVNDIVTSDTVQTPKKKAKKEETEYEKIMKKEAIVTDGLFRVRHIDDKYYFEVADSLLGRLLLCVTRYTSVPQDFGQFAGEEVAHSAVYLEERDTTRLLLRQYVQSHVADDGDNISRTLELSTVDPIVEAFKVIGRDPSTGDRLIDVTQLFSRDGSLTGLPAATKTALKVGALQQERTFIDTLCVFPLNIEVKTTRTYASSAARSGASKTGSITLGLNTSMVLLPREPMRRRLWDSRIGYFTNTFVRFSDSQRKTDHEAFVSRYRLVPRDRKKYLRGELVEPVKPIVYYIDPATPEKWVPYLIKGVEDWNTAFEAAGFKRAIQARPWPKDRPDMSLEDARYSVIRYLPSETENAYGPRIVDPRSGEIIEAHVCWYHNVMSLLTKWYMVQCGPLDKRARTMELDDELMGQLIRFVSSHEVGHTLGLRHNMGASFATPVERLRDKRWVEQHGHTASIMDYARFNYVAQPEDNISEKGLFPRIGDYDRWAIRWGYQWRPEFSDEYEEKEKLRHEATQTLAGNQRLWFGGEGRGDDPRSQTEDLGDNSMTASEYGLRNLRRVVEALPQWTLQPDYQYDHLSTAYAAAQQQYQRYVNHVALNIGGRYQGGLPGEQPYRPVPAERQREAVEWLGAYLFTAQEWLYPEAITGKTGTNASLAHGQMQEAQLSRLLSPALLATMAQRGDYGPEQFLADLAAQVWCDKEGTPWQRRQRRTLQRCYLLQLDRLLNPSEADTKSAAAQRNYSSDAILYAWQGLDAIEAFCRSCLSQAEAGSIDSLHYADALRTISLIRERHTKAK